jgi:hypothetical protein
MAHFQNWIVTVAKQSVADISSAENQRKSHAFFCGWKLAALWPRPQIINGWTRSDFLRRS